MDIGRVGIWTPLLERQPAARAQEAVRELEELGFGAVWVGEATGREALTHAGLLLAGSTRIVVGTGIANIWGRDAVTMAAAQRTLAEAYPGRFILGLGASHAFLVDDLRGHDYRRPLSAMRRYLEAMDRAPYTAVAPAEDPPRVLAALGPKMLALAAERATGAHPYFVPVEHTAHAREILGPDALLAPEQAVVLESDPGRAREVARRHMKTYLALPNYTNNLRRFGWSDADLADGGSDLLVDALVAWGGPEAAAERVRAHHDAGADHVAVQVLHYAGGELPREGWRSLADALTAELAASPSL